MSDQNDQFQPKIPNLKVGDVYGRWGQKITRVERFGPSDGRQTPAWWVGPMKNRNQGAVSHLGHSVYYELEDNGMTDEQRNRRMAEELVAKVGAHGLTAEMVYDSYGLDAPSESDA
jgi:hypothetical protein